MKRLKTQFTFVSSLFVVLFFYTMKAFAVCPICTVAVVAGVGLSRYLGVDDTITGTWIGGVTVSVIIWTIFWFEKREWKFPFWKTIITVVWYLLLVVPLYFTDIMGHPLNRLWGIDKLFLGIIVGSIFFFLGAIWYFYLKKRHGGHAYFPFQKVVMPIAPLIIWTIIFYLIT